MGMVDTIVMQEVKCPICKKYVELMGFQTKAFQRNGAVWHEGEKLTYESEPLDMFQDVNAVLTMTICHCPNCENPLYADFLIRHSQILGCLKISNKEETWASALVDYETYFSNWKPLIKKEK